MAKKKGLQQTNSIETRSFNKGMVKDLNQGLMSEGMYINARNAVNNSTSGDLGIIGNEPSNELCAAAPYTVIGTIHLYGDIWTVFSTDDANSEIGYFDESKCEYTTIVNDTCLGFKKTNLIIGESKENFDCTWQVYWSDGLNSDRSMNVDNPPWIQDCTIVNDCETCIDTTNLNCDAIKMARLTRPPCFTLEAGSNGGELLNGTYQAVIAYSENEQRITDYSSPSNIVSLFDHRDVSGSLEVVITDLDDTYDEFILVIMGFVNQQLVARKLGVYSTNQNRIFIDRIDPAANVTVPIQLIPLDRPSYDKSEGIYKNGDFLLRVAPSTKFSFNYQPLANNIITEWVEVRYPADYYRKAGVNIGTMRDEVYPYFIRFVYDTHDRTESYHIPGRGPGTFTTAGTTYNELSIIASNVYDDPEQVFEVFNTATQTGAFPPNTTLPDGGILIKKGRMGYWQSSEIYPDDKPLVWDALCGKNIRHHKMPDNVLSNHFDSNTGMINVLGVQFTGIQAPVDNAGIPIPGIIGYEILRGSREGNKTIVAKGMLNNMGAYRREDTNELAYYPNYPYNDLRVDPFLSENWVTNDQDTVQPLGGSKYARDKFTFHSPDTTFKHPFLSAKEVKVYETLFSEQGEAKFIEPFGHPEHKVFTDFGFILAGLVGFGAALIATQGQKKTRAAVPYVDDTAWVFAGPAGAGTNAAGIVTASIAAGVGSVAMTTGVTLENTLGASSLLGVLSGLQGNTDVANAVTLAASTTAGLVPGVSAATHYEWDTNGTTGIPGILRILTSIPTFLTHWSESTDNFIRLIKAFSRPQQYALAFQSHAFFNKAELTPGNKANYRVPLDDASYLGNRLQEFGGITVNNLYRSSTVGLTTGRPILDPTVQDISRETYREKWFTGNQNKRDVEYDLKRASAHYGGLKQRLRNQYGQVDGIKILPPSSCVQPLIVDPTNPNGFTSDVIFGGDTYIGRYTEKNTFFYFYDWMFDLPDGFEYDYKLKKMLPYPTYWLDTKDFQTNDFVSGLFNMFSSGGGTPTGAAPSSFHNFDRQTIPGTGIPSNVWGQLYIVKDGSFYLFNSGVKDFYVESEVNVEYRDWGDEETERHYDPYLHTSYSDLFRTDRLKQDNFYKYNYSLSSSRYFQGFPSWSTMQYRNYDPTVAETCYSFYPNRVIYSLPQGKELRYDNWLTYLVNNFKDFTSRVTAIKPVAKNGAMILFENEAHIQFIGVDQLQTDAGTKITIGDGGLFSQPLQNLVNTDSSYEYGSCQNRLSVINTPAGLFWISQNQGKIFNYAEGLSDIAQNGMKWWFEEFLPYKLLEVFPDYPLIDNTVVGVGCQSIYDNSDGIVYFAKRDFKVITAYENRMIYFASNNTFRIDGSGKITLGDPRYFEDASWTISYDPKAKAWISFHDWKPNFLMPSKNNFLSIKDNEIWKHNDRDDSYCNFYGIDYPFEVELVTPTGQNVNTLKSLEYLMEVYQWDPNEIDKHHVLDFNFDEAVVYNTEQISGLLRLNITPKNNAPLILQYPQVNATNIDILYSKEEQKYRFNQFWDIVDNRGEFSTARRSLWNTDPNGYTKVINPLAVNYDKSPHQRKKFRHYQSNLLLRRNVSGVHNMQLKLVNSKNQHSPR